MYFPRLFTVSIVFQFFFERWCLLVKNKSAFVLPIDGASYSKKKRKIN
jgi:hypothetical protein